MDCLQTYGFASVCQHHIFHSKELDDGVLHSQEQRSLPEYGSSYWRLILEQRRCILTFLEQDIHDVHLAKDEFITNKTVVLLL